MMELQFIYISNFYIKKYKILKFEINPYFIVSKSNKKINLENITEEDINLYSKSKSVNELSNEL